MEALRDGEVLGPRGRGDDALLVVVLAEHGAVPPVPARIAFRMGWEDQVVALIAIPRMAMKRNKVSLWRGIVSQGL